VDIVKDGDTIIAAIVNEKLVCDNIRVILSNDNFSSYDMGRAIFTSDQAFTVTNKDGVRTTYQAGEAVTFVAEDYEEGDMYIVAPYDEDDTVTISSLARGYGHPAYSGVLEVRILKDGVLHTAPTDNLILPGIARAHLIKACNALNIPVKEEAFYLPELFDADEVIVTSSSNLCLYADKIDGKNVGLKDRETFEKIRKYLIEEFHKATD
ncbi:MAG: aminotransferase class IV, partial [Clostridia bacterium]|nr:aminotransferase class IV [Clostridia bacterium]